MLRDMAGSKTHTAESWANIMLKNTSRLTDVNEQEKFWRFMSNPQDEEDIPDPVCQPMEHKRIEEPEQYTTTYVDHGEEKQCEEKIKIHNEYFRNGQAVYIRSKPSKATSVSSPLPSRPVDSDEEKVLQTDFEMPSVPSVQSV
jgi:hypothetical protein